RRFANALIAYADGGRGSLSFATVMGTDPNTRHYFRPFAAKRHCLAGNWPDFGSCAATAVSTGAKVHLLKSSTPAELANFAGAERAMFPDDQRSDAHRPNGGPDQFQNFAIDRFQR